MSPCRDCSRPTPASARSCPHCGILNPVVQWVAFPDGSHVTARVAPDPVAAAAALAGKPAPRPAPAVKPASRPAFAAPAAAPAPAAASADPFAPDPFAIFAPGGAAPLPLAAAVDDFGAEVEAINKCSTAFYWLAALNGVLGLAFRDVLGNAPLLEAAIMAGLSYALRQYRSRAAAVMLVLYAGFTVYLKTMALLDGSGRVAWVWLWVLITGMAGKAALAAFKLQEQRPARALA